MKARLNQVGFGHIAGVFVVLFLAVVGFAGYKVYTLNHPAAAPMAASTTPGTPHVPAQINSSADLTNAATVLDDSSSNINTNLNDNALNSDLNAML